MSTETYRIIKEVDGKWTLYASDAQNLSKDDSATKHDEACNCLLYTSPSPRDLSTSRMPSSA